MAKVPKVLGEEHALNFKDMLTVVIGNGATRQSPIYRLPKREACLMAMRAGALLVLMIQI